MKKSITLAVVSAVVLSVLLFTGAGAGAQVNTNSASYWETQTEHESKCYKYDNTYSPHGYVTQDEKGVILVHFDEAWYGDHWELLVVKGGSYDDGYGAGNAVYYHPRVGVQYLTPFRDREDGSRHHPDVSHWIVCKGVTPDTTTTTEPVPTTTEPVPTTTEPVPTTTEPVPTSTWPEVCVLDEYSYADVFEYGLGDDNDSKGLTNWTVVPCFVPVPNPTTTVAVATPPVPTPPVSTTPSELPKTGTFTWSLLWAAALVTLIGTIMLKVRRPA